MRPGRIMDTLSASVDDKNGGLASGRVGGVVPTVRRPSGRRRRENSFPNGRLRNWPWTPIGLSTLEERAEDALASAGFLTGGRL
jgi:hypothetical protein